VSQDPRVAEIARFVRDHLLIDGSSTFSPETPLIGSGLVDSMGIVMLAAFVEERFGAYVREDEIFDGRDTIQAIVELIDRNR
jgi:acyl carrier protein